MDITEARFHSKVEAYARTLIAAGFTVYARPAKTLRETTWFHYSKDGFFGTFSGGDRPHMEDAGLGRSADHTMPLVPSKEDGSGTYVLNERTDMWSVEAAEQVARATNVGIPTGKTFKNATPWGVGTTYVEVTA